MGLIPNKDMHVRVPFVCNEWDGDNLLIYENSSKHRTSPAEVPCLYSDATQLVNNQGSHGVLAEAKPIVKMNRQLGSKKLHQNAKCAVSR